MSMFSGKKILVAGGGGFLGSHFVHRFQKEGARVRATIHERSPNLPAHGAEYVEADLRRPEDCEKVVKDIDYVFMCAASTAGAAVMNLTPLAHVTPNVVMNAQILEAAYQARVKKFLFISSSAAYPPTGERPTTEDEMFSGDPFEVYFSVGWMKRYAEVLCRIYSEKIKTPMPCVVVRPSNIYGPGDKFDPKRSHVTAALLRKVVERMDPLEVWGTGEDKRDLMYVDDFLDGALLCMEKLEKYQPLNIASGEVHTVKQVLQTLLEIDGYINAKIQFDPSKPTTIPVRHISTRLTTQVLGWKPKISLREGLTRTVAWFRENIHGKS